MREGTRNPEIVPERDPERPSRWIHWALVACAAAVGLVLMVDSLLLSSATYDETFYLATACRWWRTGNQLDISRAGSPLTFWKLQQVPMLGALDCLGHGDWIDDPARFEPELLPIARASSLWIWLSAFGLIAWWSQRLYGPRAMVLASWWFVLSPNLLAHGPLATMETPITATMTATILLFWTFLRTGDRRAFVASAAMGGLAFSCKFTAVLLPPILAMIWMIARWTDGNRRPMRIAIRVAAGIAAYAAIMAVTDVVITGGALLPISEQSGDHPTVAGRLGPLAESMIGRAIETPIPQDATAFVRQVLQQKSGAHSYLFGEVRETGWRYYYLVALAVKVPLTFWLVLVLRAAASRRLPRAGRDWILPAVAVAFVAIASIGSTRNFGVRYLLPIAPMAIVWISALAEGTPWLRRLAWGGLAAQAFAVATIHPHELTYFNAVAGGPIGGRRILSDSNLDWGQGLLSMARLQRDRPEFRDLTFYDFGDTEPARYGVAGRCFTVRATGPPGLPAALEARTGYLAVSASLQWGPWGPPGYFRALDGVEPIAYTDDTTIAIYRTADVPGLTGRDPSSLR